MYSVNHKVRSGTHLRFRQFVNCHLLYRIIWVYCRLVQILQPPCRLVRDTGGHCSLVRDTACSLVQDTGHIAA